MKCTSKKTLCIISAQVCDNVCAFINKFCNIVYNYVNAINGFTNLGYVASDLSTFEKSVEMAKGGRDILANSMLAFLVRKSHVKFPYWQFPCTALSGDQIYWRQLDSWSHVAFMLWALLVMDLLPTEGVSMYRHENSTKPSMIHKVDNSYTNDKRPLYCF